MHARIRRAAAALLLPAMLGLGALALSTQAVRAADTPSYTWHAEMVSVDTAAKAVTVKAPVEAPLTKALGGFKPGDRLMLTWIANGGLPDTGPVLYVEPQGSTKAAGLTTGYVLPVEFVAADAAARTLTVRVRVPDAALTAMAAIPPGEWLKATSPMSQPTETAAVSVVERAPKPAAFARTAASSFLAADPVTTVSSPAEFSRAMKAVSAVFGATFPLIQSKSWDEAQAQLGVGVSTMKAVTVFFDARHKDEAAGLAKDATARLQHLQDLVGGRPSAIDVTEVEAAAKAAGGACGACHAKYRDQNPVTKAYTFKAGTL